MKESSVDQANWAVIGLGTVSALKASQSNEEPLETTIAEFLAALMHLCKREGIDFTNCLNRGRDYFADEED